MRPKPSGASARMMQYTYCRAPDARGAGAMSSVRRSGGRSVRAGADFSCLSVDARFASTIRASGFAPRRGLAVALGMLRAPVSLRRFLRLDAAGSLRIDTEYATDFDDEILGEAGLRYERI